MDRLRMAVGGLITLLVGLGGAAPGARAEPACTPVARVTGAPELVTPVLGLLRERHIAVGGSSPCGAITVVLESEESRVRILILDVEGRMVERLVDDVEAAATTVESWARGDLVAPLLAAREGTPPAPASQATDVEKPAPIALVGATGPLRSVQLAAGADVAMTQDGGIWTGPRAQACVEVGKVCIGALVGYLFDTEVRGDTERLGSSRKALDLRLTGEVPFRLARGAAVIAVGGAIGETSTRARRNTICDPCSDEDSTVALGLHAAGAARITGAWFARLDVTSTYFPYGRTLIGETEGEPQDDDPLAGSPRWRLGLALSLAYGGL